MRLKGEAICLANSKLISYNPLFTNTLSNMDTSGNANPAADGQNPAGGAPAPGGEQLNIKVKAQDGTEIFFKIKKSTQLKKLMEAYC